MAQGIVFMRNSLIGHCRECSSANQRAEGCQPQAMELTASSPTTPRADICHAPPRRYRLSRTASTCVEGPTLRRHAASAPRPSALCRRPSPRPPSPSPRRPRLQRSRPGPHHLRNRRRTAARYQSWRPLRAGRAPCEILPGLRAIFLRHLIFAFPVFRAHLTQVLHFPGQP